MSDIFMPDSCVADMCMPVRRCSVCANPASALYRREGQACSTDDVCCPQNQLSCVEGVCTPYCNKTTDATCNFCLTAKGVSCSQVGCYMSFDTV